MYGGLDIITNLGEGKLGKLKNNKFGNFYTDKIPETFADSIIIILTRTQILTKKSKIKKVFAKNFDYVACARIL